VNPPLTALEQRVLGVLIEKDMATPDYYPMSLHALTTACNQKTSREPITDYDDITVHDGLKLLEERELAETRYEGRVNKYAHRASFVLNLNNRELALIAILLLRGPQTLNELKDRTQRLYAFDDLESVESSLRKLSEREQPLAIFLGKLPGQREPRWMHLLGGPVDIEALSEAGAAAASASRGSSPLEARIDALESELRELKEQFADFRRQFEN
jgi:uncharacterized protein